MLAYCVVALVVTLLAAVLYRRAWQSVRGHDRVPTGFGAFLAPVLLGAAATSGASSELMIALCAIGTATLIYWIDDAVELSARIRLLIAFVTGAIVAATYTVTDPQYALPVLLGIIVAAGFIAVALINMVNFCDGADLNLATFIALTAVFILLFVPPDQEWATLAAAMIAFIVPFAALNRRPRTIYLGDSGSFAFAGVLTLMAVAFLEDFANLPPEAALPAALPALDVFYVFAVRVWERHDLLSRNYMHLYQRLNRRYEGWGYLLPQLINPVLCLFAAWSLQGLGIGRILSVVLAMVTVTIPFYFLCRRLFLSGPVEGPLQESRS